MALLKYSQDFDKKLVNQVENILNVKVKNIDRLDQGEVNFAYKIAGENKTYHARIFRYQGWPVAKRLQWISDQLEAKKIPQSKTLYIDSSSEVFPLGFMISEWIDGKNGWAAIHDGDISFEIFHKKLGKLLRKIHTIEVKKFGELPEGHNSSAIEFFTSFINDEDVQKLLKKKYIKSSLLDRYQKTAVSLFTGIKLPPAVLVHADPTPDNVIWSKDNLVLIDWDDALAGIWVQDLAYLLYHSKKPEQLKLAFLRGYGKINQSEKELTNLIKVSQMRISLNLLPYYKFDYVDEEQYQIHKKRLEDNLL